MAKKKKKKVNKKKSVSDSAIVKTQKEAAEYAGVDERTIRRWVKIGMPVVKGGGYFKALLDNYKKTGGKDYNEEKHKSLTAEASYKDTKAKLLDIELKIKQGKLLDAEEVEAGRIKRILAVKRLLLSLPRSLAAKVRGKPQRQAQKIINDEIEDVVRVFSGEESTE